MGFWRLQDPENASQTRLKVCLQVAHARSGQQPGRSTTDEDARTRGFSFFFFGGFWWLSLSDVCHRPLRTHGCCALHRLDPASNGCCALLSVVRRSWSSSLPHATLGCSRLARCTHLLLEEADEDKKADDLWRDARNFVGQNGAIPQMTVVRPKCASPSTLCDPGRRVFAPASAGSAGCASVCSDEGKCRACASSSEHSVPAGECDGALARSIFRCRRTPLKSPPCSSLGQHGLSTYIIGQLEGSSWCSTSTTLYSKSIALNRQSTAREHLELTVSVLASTYPEHQLAHCPRPSRRCLYLSCRRRS